MALALFYLSNIPHLPQGAMRLIPKTTPLTGQRLANVLALAHPLCVDNPGKITVTYIGGGWIEMSGIELKPHPDLASQYPKGWSLYDRMRTSRAREIIKSAVALPVLEPIVFKKGDLVWWHAPSSKFWGIVMSVSKDRVYIISDCSGFDADRDTLTLTTIESIIRHYKKKYGHSAERTRDSVRVALVRRFRNIAS